MSHTCVNPLGAPPSAARVLVIRLGAVGDVVRTLPAVTALRAAYPDARLAWLVEEGAASLLRDQPWLDEVIVFPRAPLVRDLRRLHGLAVGRRLARFGAALRARRFELVVDFHSILKSAVLARLTGAPWRVGYARPFGQEAAPLLATHRAVLAPRRQSRFARNEALVRFLGIQAAPALRPLCVPPARQGPIDVALAASPATRSARDGFAVLHPGTSDATPYKRWSVEGYARVARGLAAGPGIPSLISVGPARDDRAFADAVVAAAAGAATRAPDTPELGSLAALLTRARVYVGSDTGPMHVASLVGTPVVQLIGPTDPVENAPWPATPSRTLRVQIACNPCRRGCAAASCMAAIDPDAVLGAARELLAARQVAAS